jgi:tRNA(Ile)-lysidine synthase
VSKHKQGVSPVELALASAIHEMPAEVTGSRIAVAFSGGLDSVCLADLLNRCGLLQATLTVDHALQAGSAQWARRCEDWSLLQGIDHQSLRIDWTDTKALTQRGVEEAAREARYLALEQLAKTANCSIIALAHHADDQAETVLLQALRGSGVHGLSAMPVWRQLRPGLWLWRPLLGCTKQALAHYCVKRQLAFIEDPSNQDERLRRNAMRQQLMPVLATIAPAYRETLARVAQHAAQAAQLLGELAEQDWVHCQSEGAGLVIARFLGLSPLRQALVLRHWCEQFGLRAPSQARLADMLRKIKALAHKLPPVGAVVLAFEGVEWRVRSGVLIAQRALKLQRNPVQSGTESFSLTPWLSQGVHFSESLGGRLELRRLTNADQGKAMQCISYRLLSEAAAANAHAQLRLRSSGSGRQLLRLQANRPSRRLKNLYQESHLDIAARNATPLLYLNDELVAVPGLGVAASWQAAPSEQHQDAYVLVWQAFTAACLD